MAETSSSSNNIPWVGISSVSLLLLTVCCLKPPFRSRSLIMTSSAILSPWSFGSKSLDGRHSPIYKEAASTAPTQGAKNCFTESISAAAGDVLLSVSTADDSSCCWCCSSSAIGCGIVKFLPRWDSILFSWDVVPQLGLLTSCILRWQWIGRKYVSCTRHQQK